MKHVVCLLLLLFVVTFCVFAQTEDPEPVAPPQVSYEVEMAWGPRVANLSWTTAPVIDVTTVVGAVGVHSYRWTTLGQTTWEFTPVDFDVANPTKVQILLEIDALGSPNGRWGFYRVRVRGVGDMPDPEPDIVGAWSESWWVPILDIQFPGRPIRP